MCGFVVVLSLDKTLDESLLDQMRDRLIHRGPDAKGSSLIQLGKASLGLAHRRLAIIDLRDEANQPFWSDCGQYCIVFNGEIYNYIELRNRLTGLGASFQTTCDTEVLLEAYRRWKEECVGKFNGMFSFVIWDAKEEKLVAARDRFGEKPFYWTRLPCGGMAIASEQKALFAHPRIEAKINHDQLHDYLNGTEVVNGSFFCDIEQLSPAHGMVISKEGSITKSFRYWSPRFSPLRSANVETVERECYELLKESIKKRIHNIDVPVCATLSGGLDSSLLVGMIQKEGWSPQIASLFSARFDQEDPTVSEGTYIDRVLQFMQSEEKAESISPSDQTLSCPSELRQWIWHQEQPASSSGYISQFVFSAVQSKGYKVLIEGQGADELLAGYSHYIGAYQYHLLRKGKIRELIRYTKKIKNALAQEAKKYHNPERRFSLDPTHSMLTLIKMLLTQFLQENKSKNQGDVVQCQIIQDLQKNTLPDILRDNDLSAMRYSVEARLPFLDSEFVDFCLQLPIDCLIQDEWQKMILRKISQNLMPPSIQWRIGKVGYAAPQDRWIQTVLRSWVYHHLFEEKMRSLPYYDERQLRQWWQEHQTGRANHSQKLWKWAAAGEWLQLCEERRWEKGVFS